MRLGGHQTFYLRPGWLTKGLYHLTEVGEGRFAAPEVADSLGVGRNMSKAIGWWLYATGLASFSAKRYAIAATDFGNVILRHDPYMTHVGTWWLIHATTMTMRSEISLRWFFSAKRPYRFSRTKLTQELLHEFEQAKGKAVPSLKQIQREIALALKTYAIDIPKSTRDPEDNLNSPLQRLNLIHHVTTTDHFERARPVSVPPEALGICLSCKDTNKFSSTGKGGSKTANSLGVLETATQLGQNFELILELAECAPKHLGRRLIEVFNLAGERVIQVRDLSAAEWAQSYYDRLGIRQSGAMT